LVIRVNFFFFIYSKEAIVNLNDSSSVNDDDKQCSVGWEDLTEQQEKARVC